MKYIQIRWKECMLCLHSILKLSRFQMTNLNCYLSSICSLSWLLYISFMPFKFIQIYLNEFVQRVYSPNIPLSKLCRCFGIEVIDWALFLTLKYPIALSTLHGHRFTIFRLLINKSDWPYMSMKVCDLYVFLEYLKELGPAIFMHWNVFLLLTCSNIFNVDRDRKMGEWLAFLSGTRCFHESVISGKR